MTRKQLEKILSNHRLWLSGKGGSCAHLAGAYLAGANLAEAYLAGAKYNLLDMLQIRITKASEGLTLELMKWDATACGQKAMNAWAKGGSCPFSGNLLRLFQFTESKSIWESGEPKTTLLELWQWITKENKIRI